jgi:hypothetical protein
MNNPVLYLPLIALCSRCYNGKIDAGGTCVPCSGTNRHPCPISEMAGSSWKRRTNYREMGK